MNAKRLMAFLVAFAASCSLLLTGCGNTPNEETVPAGSLEVPLTAGIPAAKEGKRYDLSAIIKEEKGVDYSAQVTYTDPETGETKELKVARMKFTPVCDAELTVVIEGESKENTYYSKITIPIEVSADAIEKLLATNGKAGTADDGVMKTVTKEENFIKAEGSTSALKTVFSPKEDGTVLLDLTHYGVMQYYNARAWDDAAVIFWVYNPMEQDVQLKITGYDPYTEKTFDWNTPENDQIQVAKAGQWTQAAFSLYKLGIDRIQIESTYNSNFTKLNLSAACQGEGECTLYFDGIDMVNASAVEGLESGKQEPVLPEGDFSDLLASCTLSSNSQDMNLTTQSKKTNNSPDAVKFSSAEMAGWPAVNISMGKTVDISGFTYLAFDAYAENAYPYAALSVCYLDENGEEKYDGVSFDYKRETWTTLRMSLRNLKEADLTKVVGFRISVNMGDAMVQGVTNSFYFDNLCLYAKQTPQPQMTAPIVEDDDLISGISISENVVPGVSGVCKVTQDDEGVSRSNSMLLLWANTPTGYPCPKTTFWFDQEQDWSDYTIFNFDSHVHLAHFLMDFTIIMLDEEGNEVRATKRNDAVLTNWMSNAMPLQWFETSDGTRPDFKRVIGLEIGVDLHVNLTGEVGYIYLDNVYLS